MSDSDAPEKTGERFRMVADELYDGNKSALARALEMQPGSFSKYVRGERRPGTAILNRLTRLGINLNWFVTGNGPMLIDSTEPTEPKSAFTVDSITFRRIPLVQVRIDDGGTVQLDEVGANEWVRHSFLRRQYEVEPERVQEFQLPCNRMAPVMRPGDRVWIYRLKRPFAADAIRDGTPYLFFGPSGIFTMRAYRRGNGSIVLTGENEQVADQEVQMEEWNEVYQPLARVLEVKRPL